MEGEISREERSCICGSGKDIQRGGAAFGEGSTNIWLRIKGLSNIGISGWARSARRAEPLSVNPSSRDGMKPIAGRSGSGCCMEELNFSLPSCQTSSSVLSMKA
jgi:hypothetical protein